MSPICHRPEQDALMPLRSYLLNRGFLDGLPLLRNVETTLRLHLLTL